MTVTAVKLEPLFKRTSAGKVQIWEIRVEPNDDGSGTLIINHGLVDGKKQESSETITEGKNVGKKNETTPYQQAVAEARSRWNKQRDRRHYGLTVEESEAKRAAAPMLAQEYSKHGSKVDWEGRVYAQPKFDGHRCLISRTAEGAMMFSRGGELIESCPHIAEDVAAAMPIGSVLDGELYIHGEPLNKIGSYIRRKQEMSEQLKFMAYDYANPSLQFARRFAELLEFAPQLARNSNIIVSSTTLVSSEGKRSRDGSRVARRGLRGCHDPARRDRVRARQAFVQPAQDEVVRGRRVHDRRSA